MVNEGRASTRLGMFGWPALDEELEIYRDIELVRLTKCPLHICHISTRKGLDLVRAAKADGLPVTCETGPHYLTLCDMELQDDGGFRMNPPIRSAEDRDALVAALLDGTIDCIATDHAPHSAQEKSGGLRSSLNGIVGLECAFPVLYTQLVESGIADLPLLLDRLCVRPRNIFRLPGGAIEEGAAADLTVIDPRRPHAIDPDGFRSMGRATPFAGWPVTAAIAMTICGGEIVYHDLNTQEDAL